MELIIKKKYPDVILLDYGDNEENTTNEETIKNELNELNDNKQDTDEIKFDNNYIIKKFEENKENKMKKIVEDLQSICPHLPKDIYLDIFNKCISIHQSNNQSNGSFLENEVASELSEKNIPFRKQVIINKDGSIIGFNEKNNKKTSNEKKSKCYHIVDFVIGDNININTSITEYKVISCKTTCRERWTQDDWTFTYNPLKYILLTIANDYPSSTRFRETDKRKIITCYPKKKDDRKYKLNFENLIDELI
jgi:hypothetical protein